MVGHLCRSNFKTPKETSTHPATDERRAGWTDIGGDGNNPCIVSTADWVAVAPFVLMVCIFLVAALSAAIDPMLGQSWSTVRDAGLTLGQWVTGVLEM